MSVADGQFVAENRTEIRVPPVYSWFFGWINYFQYRYSLPSSDYVKAIDLVGYHSTYQIFDLSRLGPSSEPWTVILKQNDENVIISNREQGNVKLSLSEGQTELMNNPQLIIIGRNIAEIELKVNFAALNDVLIREYISIIVAFFVINAFFVVTSHVRGKSQSRNIWTVLEVVGKPYYICPMLGIAHGAFNKSWLENIVPSKESALCPDSEILAERNEFWTHNHFL